MKPLLLFDLDKTLFDTNRFVKIISTAFIDYLGTPPKKFDDLLTRYHDSLSKSTDYQPEEFFKHVINSLRLDKKPKIHEKLRNLFFAKANFTRSLYPDTLPALTVLSSRSTLGIFSEGYASYQKAKLVKSGLIDLIDPKYIIIHRRKTKPESLSLLPQNCTVVDDRLEVVTELATQTTVPLTPIWLNRKDQSKHPSARTIYSLNDLANI